MTSIKWIYQKSRLKYYCNDYLKRKLKRDVFKPNYKKNVMTAEEGNKTLALLIESGRPFAATRFGNTEAKTIADVLYTKAGGRFGGIDDETLLRITNNAGFFPKDREKLFEFNDLYIDCALDVDLLGVWDIFMQSYLADEVTRNANLGELRMFEPYYFKDPWSKKLMGKKILVIHPFSETIERQFKKRDKLFDNKFILPEFELKTLTAVQTLAGNVDIRFKTWFEALDYMYEEALKKEFDIALIGCGAYGFPLAVKLKRAGKQAIHIGGALQILFGIRGNRWNNHPIISKLYNETWVNPSENERVPKCELVENSCYW